MFYFFYFFLGGYRKGAKAQKQAANLTGLKPKTRRVQILPNNITKETKEVPEVVKAKIRKEAISTESISCQVGVSSHVSDSLATHTRKNTYGILEELHMGGGCGRCQN